METKKDDVINSPSHYQILPGVEAIDIIDALGLDFEMGNAVKYLLRAGKKGGEAKLLEDYKKARFYLDRKIGKLEANQK